MRFKGIMPALVTPLNEDETINVEVLKKLIEFLLQKGADGFYVGGATGEGLSLKTEERMILAEEAINAVKGSKPCIVQVAAADFGDALSLAKHAEQIGADAISATPPLFFQYDEEDVYNYYKALAQAVHIPMMIYNTPAASFKIDATFTSKMFEIDNVTAIKWTVPDYYEMIRLKDLTHGEMNIINGPDEMLLMGLNAGADGGIGTTYNFMFDIIKSIYNNFRQNNIEEAQTCQTLANRIIAQIKKYHTIPVAKLILEEMGFMVGNATFPMKRYTDKEQNQILSDVRNAGLCV